MAGLDSTQTRRSARNVTFAAGGASGAEFYQLHENATTLDIVDHLNARLSQLRSMLAIAWNPDTRQDWSTETLDNYMGACLMLAEECKDLSGHIDLSKSA
jgi:hypothetical protein